MKNIFWSTLAILAVSFGVLLLFSIYETYVNEQESIALSRQLVLDSFKPYRSQMKTQQVAEQSLNNY